MKDYAVYSKHTTNVTVNEWLSFADLVEVERDDLSYTLKGVSSVDSVMVVPVRYVNGVKEVGILKEQRPLFCGDKWLAAFPAGKVEKGQNVISAAHLESLQEAGLILSHLKYIGVDMPFLHICSEKVHLLEGEMASETEQQLEEGEFIDGKLTWMPWEEFKAKVIRQQKDGTPLLENAPMMGVSLISANKLIAMGF